MPEHQVQSPLPGVFYRTPSPDKPPYVEVGDAVTADTTIGLVEVMKQFAEIKAGAAGTVTAFVVEHAGLLGPGDSVAVVEVG